MTVADIFAKINAHMIEGVMFHSQMAEYFAFLNLGEYEKLHKLHACHEFTTHGGWVSDYVCDYNKLLPEYSIDKISVIPDSWRNHVKQDVDTATKQRAVKDGFEKWRDWEKQTKELYEKSYSELITIGEISAANSVCNLIYEVAGELRTAERKLIDLAAVNYDMGAIIAAQ